MKNAILCLCVAGLLAAQVVPNPTQRQETTPPVTTMDPVPIFRVTVVSRTIKAVNFHHRSGWTKIDFRGTELLPAAKGEAKVESQMGSTKIDTRFDHLSPATQFGPEYLTYVMWAITPEGRAQNLGEVVLTGSDNAKLLATTELQAFGLMVTAEPYFAVTQPSDVVVMENFIRTDTTGTIQPVEARYELLKRGGYVLNRSAYRPIKINPKGPLQLAEAENAVEIARLTGAEKYAADSFRKAMVNLENARAYTQGKGNNSKSIETTAREAAQTAEDSRIITLRKMEEEEQARRRAAEAHAKQQAAQARDAAAQSEARREEEARRAAEARAAAAQSEAQRQAEAARAAEARAAADTARAAAETARREREQADAAKAAAIAEQERARAETERARQAAQQAENLRQQAESGRQQAENDKAEMRRRLQEQLNLILETRQTARGLIVNISDVLFDFNKYTLKPGAREKMAKVSGILLAYPSLKIQLEGHTDSVGSDEYNLELSQKRADTVRAYLMSQGVPVANVTAVGLGKNDPVASNDSAAGRQQNRRVEMVVSGDAIGFPGGSR